ncbi:MAG TPA: hypothetical protein PLO67_14160 [Saprospiraceae bacterium]|nr:hypothetical protein [Saprospiraceae bacterium]HPI06620.1 hypothetical protein [Saprospiraceae bacterium]
MSKINQNWIFGNSAGLDFSTANSSNPPTPITGSAINTAEGCASISDANGNLLFYTDGITVWDSGHTPRVTGLLGDPSSTQSAIIVPDPANNSQYYIFTMDGSSNPNPPFNHLNGGLLHVGSWVFTPLSSLLTLPSTAGFSPAEKVTAIQHKNCKDFWIITVLQTGTDGTTSGSGVGNALGTFRVFLVNSSGIQYIGDTPMNVMVHELGYLKGSPNGQMLAIANGTNRNVLIYPFDNSTGLINTVDLRTVSVPTVQEGMVRDVYGVEFSPNSNLLYYGTLTKGTPGYIFQVDLSATTLSSTQVGAIPNQGGRYAIGALQLGIDGRIYIAKDTESQLGAILSPNTVGLGCNVNNTYITLPAGAFCVLGLPNLLPNPCEDSCDCGCTGCNKEAEMQNQELIDRAKTKYNTIQSRKTCARPFGKGCKTSAIQSNVNLEPCFYFHWGDGSNDQIEEHDTEVFYLTVCNPFNDIRYNGFKITKVTLIPNVHPLDKIQIVPDRFVCLDCIEPCSCQTREFAMITRANNTAGNYMLEIEYCYESISLASGGGSGKIDFDLKITED